MADMARLERRLPFSLVVFYGLGTTIGAGIYALVGEIAGVAGYHAPWSFLVAAALASLTAASYAEMSARYPKAAGSALYVREGFGRVSLSTLVGLLVALAGMTSAAALTNAFVSHLQEVAEVQRATAIILTVLVMGAIAAIGIAQSVAVASVLTVIEIFGLGLVVAVNADSFAALPQHIDVLLPPPDLAGWSVVLAGAMLAFYAFLGFEDMVVIAEEVKHVRRTLPLAILVTLAVTTVLYVLVMTVAVLALPPEKLAASAAPLTLLYETGSGASPVVVNAIAMLAIINGTLIQIIMASRLLYGLASQGQLPAPLATVHPWTHTPLIATLVITLLVLLLSLPGTLRGLAQATSVVMLAVFALVNLAAWRVKRRTPASAGLPYIPVWLPLLGFLVSVAFVLAALAG